MAKLDWSRAVLVPLDQCDRWSTDRPETSKRLLGVLTFSELQHIKACAKATLRGSLRADDPLPPKDHRAEIAEAGGNMAWINSRVLSAEAYSAALFTPFRVGKGKKRRQTRTKS